MRLKSPDLTNGMGAAKRRRSPWRQRVPPLQNQPRQQPAAQMEIVEQVQRSWILLTDGTDYYLDILCSLSDASFSLLIKLTDDERSSYRQRGMWFIHEIVKSVQRSPTLFYARNQSIQLQKLVVSAISEQARKNTLRALIRWYEKVGR